MQKTIKNYASSFIKTVTNQMKVHYPALMKNLTSPMFAIALARELRLRQINFDLAISVSSETPLAGLSDEELIVALRDTKNTSVVNGVVYNGVNEIFYPGGNLTIGPHYFKSNGTFQSIIVSDNIALEREIVKNYNRSNSNGWKIHGVREFGWAINNVIFSDHSFLNSDPVPVPEVLTGLQVGENRFGNMVVTQVDMELFHARKDFMATGEYAFSGRHPWLSYRDDSLYWTRENILLELRTLLRWRFRNEADPGIKETMRKCYRSIMRHEKIEDRMPKTRHEIKDTWFMYSRPEYSEMFMALIMAIRREFVDRRII